MLLISTSKTVLSLIILAFFASVVCAQQNQPADSYQKKTPQEAYKGGTGIYMTKVGFDQLKEGKNEEAVKTFRKAIQLKPNYPEAHLGLGQALVNLKKWTEAVPSFQQAIRLKPDYIQAHMGLGFAYGMMGRNQDAIKAFKEAARLNPRLALAHWGLATAYLALGDRNTAVREHKIIKTLDPDMAKRFEKYLAAPGK
jgi:tetratricopeptide (TPR) repeat protein